MYSLKGFSNYILQKSQSKCESIMTCFCEQDKYHLKNSYHIFLFVRLDCSITPILGKHAKKKVDWSERIPRKADGFVREQESTANEKKIEGMGLVQVCE